MDPPKREVMFRVRDVDVARIIRWAEACAVSMEYSARGFVSHSLKTC